MVGSVGGGGGGGGWGGGWGGGIGLGGGCGCVFGILILFVLVIGSLRRPWTFPTPKGSTRYSIILLQEAVFTYSC